MNVIHQVFFLPIKLTHEAAKVPTQEIGNVGFDVYSVEEVILSPGKITRVNLGFQFADAVEPMTLSQKTLATSFMKIEGRSGLACNGIFPVGGIIDPSYRGDVKAIMFNSTDEPYTFFKGDRVAQLVCYHVLANAETVNVKFVITDKITQTERGENGFGSTGK